MSAKSNRPWQAGGDGAENAGSGSKLSSYSTTPCRAGQAVYSAQGRPVGVISSDSWLEKRVDPAMHMLRKPPGWATDEDHLALPIRGVRLRCPDGTTYEASIELFRRHGFVISRGFGVQILLPIAFWTVQRPGQPVQLPLEVQS